MSPLLERLRDEALTLPEDERRKLVDSLSESLGNIPNELALSPEWMAEIDRRTRALENGTAELIDEEDVERELQQMLENG